jgi:ketosteroid isomerase-like protein
MTAFNGRDVKIVLELMDPSIEFYAPLTAQAVDRMTPYHGHDGIRQYFDDVSSVWHRLEVNPREFLSRNEHVVALGSVSGEREGQPVHDEVAWAWRLRRGRIAWGRVYQAAAEALKDAGITETP